MILVINNEDIIKGLVMIFGVAVHELLAWALALFFLVGAIGNGIAPTNVRQEYARWGYPDWFHFVTAALELLVAAFFVFPATRELAVGLGALIMLAAIATLLFHKEFKHALLPTTVLIVLIVQLYLAM